MITISGCIERIVYQNPENHYTIARLRSDEAKNQITLVGHLPGISPGENVAFTGDWDTHEKYGQQFKVDTFEIILPGDVDGIEKYLKSGVIKGIGEKTAVRLVNHFKECTLDVMDHSPERLLEVEGIGPRTAERIMDAWKAHNGIRELMDFLQEHNLSPAFGAKILARYGGQAVSIVSRNPYCLCRDILEIDFPSIDYLASRLGIPMDDPDRISACIEYQIRVFIEDGNTYMPKSLLLERLSRRFGIESTVADRIVEDLIDSDFLVSEPETEDPQAIRLYPAYLHQAETMIGSRISALLTIPRNRPDLDEAAIVAEVTRRVAVIPSREQLDILREILFHRFAVITGGPGTGKTTLVRSITAILSKTANRVLLAAPTGRAARRLSEVTGRTAETLHKMLRFNPATGIFDKNRDDPLECDTLIVDEASMIDTVLMAHLISAVPMNCSMILVGDIFQLPSIGPGNVLSDLIASGKIPYFELKTIFRQAHESPIVLAAHHVRKGEMPDLAPFRLPAESGFFFIEQEDSRKAVEIITELCTRTFPDQFDLDPVNDVQVITPMHKGVAGTLNLNRVLQQALNSSQRKRQIKGGRFRVNDKVMHLKNNYQKDVFNGDIGRITDVDAEKSLLTVNYDLRSVAYHFDELEELALAYAVSVHKSQGSEYPAVILPLTTEHFPLLQRNLLYTAITRGRHLVVIIGSRKAMRIALANDKPGQRLSSLAERLQ